jgi:hypothetical protein
MEGNFRRDTGRNHRPCRSGPGRADLLCRIDNILGTGLPIRLSFSQFQTNPFQHGCAIALTAVPGCATVNLFQNGFSNPTVPETAEEAKLGRHDRRTIVGGRWEHDFNNSTTWRTQIVFDDKNINQPTGSTSAVGDGSAEPGQRACGNRNGLDLCRRPAQLSRGAEIGVPVMIQLGSTGESTLSPKPSGHGSIAIMRPNP